MKKICVLFFLVISLICSSAYTVSANNEVFPIASDYLDSYYVALNSSNNGEMVISVSVNGVGIQDKIGVRRIDIEQKSANGWIYFNTLDAIDFPEFYKYNTRSYTNEINFDGIPGNTYRVKIMVYAKTGAGSDSGFVTSSATVCK